MLRWIVLVALASFALACDGSSGLSDAADEGDSGAPPDTLTAPPDGWFDASPCPTDMVYMRGAGVCMDLYEAPNRSGALPLVMYTFDEAEQWCAFRDKRLCFEDEWLAACEGSSGYAYPYGDTHEPGRCNDEEIWRTYNQTLLNGWPPSASSAAIPSLEALFAAARDVSPTASAAADHVEWLYQGEPAGANQGCVGEHGVIDLVGNVEEWTRRRDWIDPLFQGNLKGRYWAESRTCQSSVRTHGNGFRFYEIGFRCCRNVY